MSENPESVTLERQQSDKLGVAHVAVTEDGTAVVAGELRRLEDGESYWSQRAGIEVRREGDRWIFTRRARQAA